MMIHASFPPNYKRRSFVGSVNWPVLLWVAVPLAGLALFWVLQ